MSSYPQPPYFGLPIGFSQNLASQSAAANSAPTTQSQYALQYPDNSYSVRASPQIPVSNSQAFLQNADLRPSHQPVSHGHPFPPISHLPPPPYPPVSVTQYPFPVNSQQLGPANYGEFPTGLPRIPGIEPSVPPQASQFPIQGPGAWYPNNEHGSRMELEKEEGELSEGEVEDNASPQKLESGIAMTEGRDMGIQDTLTVPVLSERVNTNHGQYNPEDSDEYSPPMSPFPLHDNTVHGIIQETGLTVNDQNQKPSPHPSFAPFNPPSGSGALSGAYPHGAVFKSSLEATSKRYSPALGKSATELRASAKNALLNLAPYKIRFHELASEDIDSNTLRSLYEELGFHIPARATADREVVEDLGSPEIGQSMNVTTDSSIPDQKFSTEAGKSHSPGLPKTGGLIESAKSTTVSSSKTSSLPRSSKNLPPKTSIENGSLSKGLTKGGVALERKDYIARMLAARNNKAADNLNRDDKAANSDGSNRHSLTRHQADAAQRSTTPDTQEQLQATVSISTKLLDSSTSSRKAEISEEKRKAQTELARLRMEALKRQNAASKSGALGLHQPLTTLTPNSASNTTLSPQAQVSHQIISDSQAPTPVSSVLSSHPQSLSPLKDDTHSDIPGLFMSSTPQPDPPLPVMSPVMGMVSSNDQVPHRRKRPVASDFDSEPMTIGGTYKRPFGQSKSESFIIDISDDESRDDAGNDWDGMEDATSEQVNKTEQLTLKSSVKHLAIRDLPPLTDVPVKKPFPRAASGVSHSRSGHSPVSNKGKEAEVLKQKEEQILLLQRKIAEMEQRKRAKPNPSGSQTPVVSRPASTSSQREPASLNPSTSISEPQSLEANHFGNGSRRQESGDDQVPKDVEMENGAQTRSEPISITQEVSNTAGVISSSGSYPTTLPTEIASIPDLNVDGVDGPKNRLELLKQELLDLEEEVQRKLLRRKVLAEELKSLGVNPEGLPVETLQAKRDAFSEQDEEPMGTTALVSIQVGTATLKRDSSPYPIPMAPSISTEHMDPSNTHVLSEEVPAGDSSRPRSRRGPESSIHQAASKFSSDKNSDPIDPSLTNLEAEVGDDEHGVPPGDITMQDSYSTMPNDSPADQSHVEELSRDQLVSNPQASGLTPSFQLEINHPQTEIYSSRKPSGEHHSSHETSEPDSHDRPDKSSLREMVPAVESYEPPEPSSEMRRNQSVSPSSSLSTPAMEEVSYDSAPRPDSLTNSPLVGGVSQEQSVNQGIDGAIETSNDVPVGQQLEKDHHFQPYESPLKMFKAYRYHPSFRTDVPSGFRSLTYSHNLNPNKPICQYETAGGVCNDATCTDQHFRNMGLSDDMILVQMGSVNEGRTEEEKYEYRRGLMQIIQDMRGRKVKDFNVVASEIAAYRAKFFNDPTRVIVL